MATSPLEQGPSLISRSLHATKCGQPNKRLKLAGALVLTEAIMSCPDGRGASFTTHCAGGSVARSLSAIR